MYFWRECVRMEYGTYFRRTYNTRLNHKSERNAHNLSKNGVTTIFQSAIWSMVLPALEVF